VALTTSNLTAAGGTLLSNYSLPATDNGAGNITPATLTYIAQPTTALADQILTGLTGSVTGFVANDNLVNSTSGTPTWAALQTSFNQPGIYGIFGRGLNSTNYTFVNAARNASVLSILPAQPSSRVRNLTTQFENDPANYVMGQEYSSVVISTTIGGELTPDMDKKINAIDRDTNLILTGGNAPSLNIVKGGVKVPDDLNVMQH
jgi:hypothetical protein